MSRGLWFVAGAGAGIYAMVRGRRAAEAFTADGMRDRLGAAGVGLRMFRDEVAQGTVELFLRYVREPLLASGLSSKVEAERLVAAFRLTLQAATELVSYNFQRTLLNALQEELEQRGSRAERAALRKDVARRLNLAKPA